MYIADPEKRKAHRSLFQIAIFAKLPQNLEIVT